MSPVQYKSWPRHWEVEGTAISANKILNPHHPFHAEALPALFLSEELGGTSTKTMTPDEREHDSIFRSKSVAKGSKENQCRIFDAVLHGIPAAPPPLVALKWAKRTAFH